MVALTTAQVVIDRAAIAHNLRTIARSVPSAQIMAILKADAYGHGLMEVATAAKEYGVRWFGVARPQDALTIRAGGISPRDGSVFTWLHSPADPYEPLIASDIDCAVTALWDLEAIASAAKKRSRAARVHVKVDTGMGRNGVRPEELPAVATRLAELSAGGLVQCVGLWSHLSESEVRDSAATAAQKRSFEQATAIMRAAGIEPELRHCANSAATLASPDLHYDLVRVGLAMDGLSPWGDSAEQGLIPAMTVQAKLATVKKVPAGTGISYGHRAKTARPICLGVVPLGYADGVPRQASGIDGKPGGAVCVNGRIARVIGAICMDQFMVDLGPDAADRPGDLVTLFGETVRGVPAAEDWATAAGTISYDIVSRIGPRLARSYRG